MRTRALLLAAAALGACATPPIPAPRPVPAGWDLAAPPLPAEEIEENWWRAFGDPLLDTFMQAAGTIDEVAIAQTRLDEARAGLKSARSRLAPELSGGANGSSRRNGDGGVFARARNANIAASALWDPDFFGANRTRAKSARASAEGAAFDLAQARLDARLTAALLYFSVREAQMRQAAAEETAQALQEERDLIGARTQAGLVSAFDLAQARGALARAQAALASARQAAAEARLGLEALLGKPPGSLRADLDAQRLPPRADLRASLLTPLEVIARRPDLRAAEQHMRAAGWDAQAARRDFFPKLTLSGIIGVQWNDPETPFTANGGLYNVAGSLAAPLLTFGRLEGARAGADARLQRAALEYRNAAENAVSQVETELITGIESNARADAQEAALAAATDQVGFARSRYESGLSPLQDVLEAQQAMFEARAALASALAEAAGAYARLSTAMGIGAGASEG